jgi:hypothetical protein
MSAIPELTLKIKVTDAEAIDDKSRVKSPFNKVIDGLASTCTPSETSVFANPFFAGSALIMTVPVAESVIMTGSTSTLPSEVDTVPVMYVWPVMSSVWNPEGAQNEVVKPRAEAWILPPTLNPMASRETVMVIGGLSQMISTSRPAKEKRKSPVQMEMAEAICMFGMVGGYSTPGTCVV